MSPCSIQVFAQHAATSSDFITMAREQPSQENSLPRPLLGVSRIVRRVHGHVFGRAVLVTFVRCFKEIKYWAMTSEI